MDLMYPQRFIVFIVSCIKPDRSKPENMLVRRGHEVITAQFCTGERRLKKKKTHIIAYLCALDQETVQKTEKSYCCTILNYLKAA